MPSVKYEKETERFDLLGLDLNRPADSIKPGKYPFLKNIRSYLAGRIEPREGLTRIALLDTPHSIRRLNDPSNSTWTRVVGANTHLYYGQTAFTDIDSGYSGDPLALVPWSPIGAPVAYMYIGDSNRMRKITAAGVLDAIGYPAPATAPSLGLGASYYSIIDEFDTVTGWAASGTAGAPTLLSAGPGYRTNSTIQYIVYDSDGTGWASIGLVSMSGVAVGETLHFDPGALDEETAVVQAVHPGSAATTIASVIYDSGTSGGCSLVLTTPVEQVAVDALLFNTTKTELVRILGVVDGPNGNTSVRVSTALTWAATDALYVAVSFRAYLPASAYPTTTVVRGDGMRSSITVGIGYLTNAGARDLTVMSAGVPVHADDYMHISVRVSDPDMVTSLSLQFDVDSGTNNFTRNYYYINFTTAQLQTPADNQWAELVFRLTDLTRVGTDTTRTLANVASIRIAAVVTNTVTVDVDSWQIGGGFGPDTGSTTAVPYVYRYRARNPDTNVPSNFSPVSRYTVGPLRQSVTVTMTQYPAPSGTSLTVANFVLDVERFGGEIATWHYVGTVANSATPSFADIYSDDVVAGQPELDNDNYQLWPVKGKPVSGTTGTVAGTTVNDIGATFSTSIAPGTRILINNQPYTVYRIISTSRLELVENAGSQSAVPWRMDEPTYLAQPFPVLWQWTGTFFGCGDPVNPGRLYYSNPNSETTQINNYIDVTAPSEPLMNGLQYNVRSYMFSSESFIQLLQTGNAVAPYRFEHIPNGKGLFSRWAIPREPCPVIPFLGRDGIYITTGGAPISLTDADLYALFPNEGNLGTAVNNIEPPAITAANARHLRLSYYDEYLYFDYHQANGQHSTLVLDFDMGAAQRGEAPGGWMYDVYSPNCHWHYGEEGQSVHALLLGSDTALYTYGGVSDDGTDIACAILTPSKDQGDPRSNKLYGDIMLDLDSDNVAVTARPFFNNAIDGGATLITTTAARSLVTVPTSTTAWVTQRNIALYLTWSVSSSARPFIYTWEPRWTFESAPIAALSWEISPTTFGMVGFKHVGLCRITHVSTADLVLTFTVDGVAQTPISIAHSSGAYKQTIFRVPVYKGKLYKVRLASSDAATEFRLDTRDTFINVKDWATDSAYSPLRVFSDYSMVEG